MGALAGSLWTTIVPQKIAGLILSALVLAYLIYRFRSDKIFDQRMKELQARGMDWKEGES